MRNPAYNYIEEMTPDAFEFEERGYWEHLQRDVYQLGLEKLMDYLIHCRTKMGVIGEVQIGRGHFIEVLQDYLDFMGIQSRIIGSEENHELRNKYAQDNPEFEIYDDQRKLTEADIIFFVECPKFIDGWKGKLFQLWESLAPGAVVVMMDTQTPTRHRDALKALSDAHLEYDRVIDSEPAFTNPEGRKRNLKIRVFRKI